MQTLIWSGLLLALTVGAGVAVIASVRAWWWRKGADRGDWVGILTGYRDLRDRGVLSGEEYRKIKTLVEPYMRMMPMAPSRAVPPVADRAESDHAAQPSEEKT